VERAYRIALESNQPAAIGWVRWVSDLLARQAGNPNRALELLEGMMEAAQSTYNIPYSAMVAMTRGWGLTEAGRYRAALEFQMQWVEIMEQNAIHLRLGPVPNSLAWTHSEIYDLEPAVDLNKRSLEPVLSLQENPGNLYWAKEMEAQAQVNLVENAFEMGQMDKAWEHIHRFEAVSVHSDYDDHRYKWTTRMKDLKGRSLLIRGDLEGAEQLAQECLGEAVKMGMKKYTGRAERLFGQILTSRGAHDLAETKLKSALANLEEVGNPKQLWITHTALARLYKQMNRPDLERQQWQAAAAVVRSTANGLDDQALREMFLAAAPVREIAEHANLR
jgi:tetratricopeptide (TPR) repeat protein